MRRRGDAACAVAARRRLSQGRRDRAGERGEPAARGAAPEREQVRERDRPARSTESKRTTLEGSSVHARARQLAGRTCRGVPARRGRAPPAPSTTAVRENLDGREGGADRGRLARERLGPRPAAVPRVLADRGRTSRSRRSPSRSTQLSHRRHGIAGSRRRARRRPAIAGPGGAARADGDPASDFLIVQRFFLRREDPEGRAAEAPLGRAVREQAGFSRSASRSDLERPTTSAPATSALAQAEDVRALPRRQAPTTSRAGC